MFRRNLCRSKGSCIHFRLITSEQARPRSELKRMMRKILSKYNLDACMLVPLYTQSQTPIDSRNRRKYAQVLTFPWTFPPLSNPPPRARNSLCSPEVLLKRVCFCRGLRRTLAPGPCSEQTSSLANGVRRVDQPKLTMGRLKECHLDS